MSLRDPDRTPQGSVLTPAYGCFEFGQQAVSRHVTWLLSLEIQG